MSGGHWRRIVAVEVKVGDRVQIIGRGHRRSIVMDVDGIEPREGVLALAGRQPFGDGERHVTRVAARMQRVELWVGR